MLTEEIINKNFENYKNRLLEVLDMADLPDAVIDDLGGEEMVKKAVFGGTSDSGVAYDGSLVACSLAIATYAKKINEMLPKSKQADEKSITKVALLSHIAKVQMFIENDNTWEKNNRGILYKFEDLDGALRCGERSILIAMNAGVNLTAEEFEAMRIMDKNTSDDNYAKLYSSTLSMVIRQANEIIYAVKHK